MSLDLVGIGKVVESVCNFGQNISNNIKDWKVAQLNHEKELKLGLQSILPQLIQLPKDEREFFITSIYPKLVQYSNYHAFSKDTKDEVLLSYAKIHPNIEAHNLKITDNNFQQLYKLVDLHLTERRTEIKKLLEKCFQWIENGNTLSLSTIQFIETLTDEDFNFLKTQIIPFIDIYNKVLIWCDEKQFQENYDYFRVFPDILVNSYTAAGNIALQGGIRSLTIEQIQKIHPKKINRHIYEIATMCDPITLTENQLKLLGILI
jgi:hypothetical protein